MRISVKRVEMFESSGLLGGLKKVALTAQKSGDSRRMKAAKQIQADLKKIEAFLMFCKDWKIKRGSYVVPTDHLFIARSVKSYITKDTPRQNFKSLWRRQ